MYNVVEKLRSGAKLTLKERTVHEIAACGILRDLHDELDALVAEAYGWPWPMEKEEILERLVGLHDQRVEEEKRGLIRWLRPEYQIPRFAPEQATQTELPDAEEGKPASTRTRAAPDRAATSAESTPWPQTVVEQISAITALIAQRPRSSAEVVKTFVGAKVPLVARHLETLALMGEIQLGEDERYSISRKVA